MNAVQLLLVLAAFPLLPLGCARPESSSKTRPAGDGAPVARTQVERGPVRVTVEVAPHPARLSDEPTLTLAIDYQQGVEVEKPPFGEAVGDFLIRDFREPLPEVRDDREIVKQVYTLEPIRTGLLQIDPIVVTFADHRPDGDGKRHTVETEAVTIKVMSVVKSEVPSLDDLAGVAGPVELPQPRPAWPWWSAAGLIVAAGVGAFVWRLRKRRETVLAQQLTPRELACRELERLWGDEVRQSDVKVYYVRLTGIVRRYIEGSTGVRAPEQTTEEFLREISRGEVFSREERQRLKDFLESADLVKFAAHRPASGDIEVSYQRARAFVGLDAQEVAA